MLLPNNKQSTKLFQYSGTARFIYNWTLAKQQENYENGGKFISDNDLRKELTQLKQTEEFQWLNNISNNVNGFDISNKNIVYSSYFSLVTANIISLIILFSNINQFTFSLHLYCYFITFSLRYILQLIVIVAFFIMLFIKFLF